MVEPAELIEDIVGDFPGNRPETRPVHTHGISARGTFRASPVAPKYCRAPHLSGAPVDALVRFSNGSGLPVQRDAVPDARGMAVRFYLDAATGSPEPGRDPAARPHTDLVAMTLPTFFTPTVEEFQAFTRATVPQPRPQLSLWPRLLSQVQMHPAIPALPAGITTSGDLGAMAFADAHPSACPAVLALAGPITGSYLGATYHAVHAFGLTRPTARSGSCASSGSPTAANEPTWAAPRSTCSTTCADGWPGAGPGSSCGRRWPNPGTTWPTRPRRGPRPAAD